MGVFSVNSKMRGGQFIKHLRDNPNDNAGDGDGGWDGDTNDPLDRIHLGAKILDLVAKYANVCLRRQVCDLPFEIRNPFAFGSVLRRH